MLMCEVGAVEHDEASSNLLLTVPKRYFCFGSLLPVFGVSFGDVSTYVCTYYCQFGLG